VERVSEQAGRNAEDGMPEEETTGNTGSPDGAKARIATGTPRGAGRASLGW